MTSPSSRARRRGSAPAHCRGPAPGRLPGADGVPGSVGAWSRPQRYGRWDSPLAAATWPGRRCRSRSCARTAGRCTGWSRGRRRPARGARARADEDGLSDHSPAEVSIRSRVHEYGGGAVCLVPGPRPRARSPTSTRRIRASGSATAAPGRVPRPPSRCPSGGSLRPGSEAPRTGGSGATADGDWVLAVREVHATGAARPRRRLRRALDARAGAGRDDPARRARLLRGALHRRRGGDGWPWSSGTTRTCRGTASTLVVVPLRGPAPRGRRPRGLAPAGEDRGWSPEGRASRWASRPGRRDGSLRFVSDRTAGGGSRSATAGSAGLRPRLLVPPDARPSGTGPTGSWARGRSRSSPTARWWPAPPPRATDELVRLGGRPEGRPRPRRVPQPCVSVAAVCAHGDGVAVIGATDDAAPNVWLWTPAEAGAATAGGAPVRLAPGDVARPAALHPHRPLGPPGARGAPPPGAARAPRALRASGRPWWCGATAARRPPVRPGWTWPCATSPPVASRWPASTTPGAPAMGGRTAAPCGGMGGGGRRGLPGRRAAPGRTGRGRPRAPGHPGRSAGGMTALNALAAGAGSPPASPGTA